MKALSQSEYGEIRSLYESMYASEEVITEELIDEIIDELVEELISEGVDEEEAYSLVEEATDTYIDEAKVTFGSDTAPIRKSGAPVGARRRYGMRKAGDALQGAKKAASAISKSAKSQALGAALAAVGTAKMAKDSAGEKITATKKKASEVKQAVQNAPGKAREAASDAKKKTKSGIKGFIKRQAQKVVSRMSEENEEVEEYIDFLITEGYDCSDLTWNDMYEEYQSLDEGLRSAVKRLLGGKKKEEPAKPMSRGDELRKKYNVGPERSDTSAKAQILKKTRAKAERDQKEFGGSRYSKGVADRSKAAHERQLKGGYSKYGADDARGSGNKARKRAAALTKEELEATGLFTAKEIEALVESENVDEAMSSYDRNRKRAAQRAADRNAARAAGKTGVVPGVGYVTPNKKERETYTDEKGTVRHKSGAKNEEFEQLDEISKKLARSYIDKATDDRDKNAKDGSGEAFNKAERREKNIQRASSKLYKGTPAGEIMGVRNPAKVGAKNEEFEQLDELSKGTMGSYIKKASKDVEKRSYTQGSTDAEDAEIGYPGQTPKDKKIDKRQKGIGRAVGKLTK